MTDVCLSLEMIELDGDEERISSQGRYAERDIVQVPIVPRAVGSAERFMNTGKSTALDPHSAIFLTFPPCSSLV